LRSRPSEFEVDAVFTVQPFREKWNPAGKSSVVMDDRPGAPKGYFWWAGNGEEVGAYWGAYQGRGVPLDAMRGANAGTLADAMFEATRTSAILWQTNKALSGEHPEARARDELTALNPVVFSNAAFVTLGDWVQYKYVGVPGHEPDEESARDQLDGVNRAMSFVKAATPGGGSYSNEGDYFEENWRQEFWGSNYERLLAVKREVDPTNLFHVHHGVGSEE